LITTSYDAEWKNTSDVRRDSHRPYATSLNLLCNKLNKASRDTEICQKLNNFACVNGLICQILRAFSPHCNKDSSIEGGASAPPPRIRRFISQVSKCGCEFLHIFFCSTSVRHGNKVSHTSSHRCASHGGKLSTGCRSSPAQCACATFFRSSSDRCRVADWPAISDGAGVLLGRRRGRGRGRTR